MKSITNLDMFHDPSYPTELLLSQHQQCLIEEFNHKILTDELEFELVPCLCGDEKFELISQFDRYRVWQPIVICRNCGFVQCRPRLTLSCLQWFYESDFYRDAYGGHKYDPMTEETFQFQVDGGLRKLNNIGTYVDLDKVNSVLEIGCAAGWNLYPFQQRGKTVVGVDYGPRLVEFGQTKGMDLRQGDITALGNETFDLIILSHVLEHVPDLNTFMTQIDKYLNQNGYVYIEVPDISEFCMGAFQTAHIYYFTIPHLNYLCAQFRLTPITTKNIGPFFFGIYKRGLDTIAYTTVPNEYLRLRKIIKRHELRERIKIFLKKTGFFPIIRSIINFFRWHS